LFSMNDTLITLKDSLGLKREEPRCPVFGLCGGCQFQDISYEDELAVKERYIRGLFTDSGLAEAGMVRPVVASPSVYHYRCRMDLKLLRIKSGEMFMGFSPVEGHRVVEVEKCPIAMEAISSFLPELRRQSMRKMPLKYRNANLTVKTGADGRVAWGGIGRRSLRMQPAEYLWAELFGKRIFYSLETFFQANLSILPDLMRTIRGLACFQGSAPVFLDLYGGVGLFSIGLADLCSRIVLIEENVHSIACARHNMDFNRVTNIELFEGKMEDVFQRCFMGVDPKKSVAMIDPPRAGLAASVSKHLASAEPFQTLLYLSCDPSSLLRDLKIILGAGRYVLSSVVPFDFFPRTRHLETLAVLTPASA